MNSKSIQRLIDIMAALRDPKSGCPWDIKQSFETIAPYTIEEAYEVADAIEHRDMDQLKDELGDLLFQVVFYAQMSREAGGFEFDDIVEAICDKMERRHPHVFGDTTIEDSEAQTKAWEQYKATEREERAQKNDQNRHESALDGVANALPALTRALKLQNRAARVGFEWEKIDDVVAKIHEEIAEFEQEIRDDNPPERLAEEYGDLLFALVNLARWLDIKPENALRATNAKFVKRFQEVEARLAERGKTPEQSDLAEMDALWNAVKTAEK